MADIIIFSGSDSLKNLFEKILPQNIHNLYLTDNVDECMKKLYSDNIDGVIIDYSIDTDLALLARKIRVIGKKKQPFVLLYSPKDYENEILFRYIDGFITKDSSFLQLYHIAISQLCIEQ